MKNRAILVLKCLVLIQFVALTACKQGQGKNSSTRVNRSKAGAQPKTGEQGQQGQQDQQGQTQGTDQTTARQGEAIGLNQNLKGKLSDGSYVKDDKGEKLNLKDKECGISALKRGDRSFIVITMDKIVDEIAVADETIQYYFKDLKKIPEAIEIKQSRENLIITGEISSFADSTSDTNGIEITREVYTFKDKASIEKDVETQIKKVRKEVAENKNYKDVTINSEGYQIEVADKKILGFKYESLRLEPGTAVGSTDNSDTSLSNETETEVEMECKIANK